MFTKMVPFKDFNDKPRNMRVHFNLSERETFKLLGEFQTVLKWRESLSAGEERTLETSEVVAFYNALEEIMLAAYGEPSEDGLYFRKAGRYDFEESALFNACMVEFVSNPKAANEMLAEILPKDLEELARKADANLIEAGKSSDDAQLKAEVERLRAQLAEKTGELGG